jgi:hypothetical protein
VRAADFRTTTVLYVRLFVRPTWFLEVKPSLIPWCEIKVRGGVRFVVRNQIVQSTLLTHRIQGFETQILQGLKELITDFEV